MGSRFLSICVFATMLLALAAVFLYAPSEREMGDVQRIFYFHVPAAMTAFAAFFIVFIASIAYLNTRQARWDQIAIAAAELGVLFSTINLVTGPLWAKPVWGVYWRWEPRLTTMLITFAMYVAYLMVRAYASGEANQMRRIAAVLGIVAFVNVPLVYYSVDLWAPEQQLHPQRGIRIAPEMAQTKYLCYLAFGLLFFYLLRLRVELERSAGVLEEIRFRFRQSS
jgi:heme exporter protein C